MTDRLVDGKSFASVVSLIEGNSHFFQILQPNFSLKDLSFVKSTNNNNNKDNYNGKVSCRIKL